jgi:hypothetical protein
MVSFVSGISAASPTASRWRSSARWRSARWDGCSSTRATRTMSRTNRVVSVGARARRWALHEGDAPAETTCWTKPRVAPRMGIVRLELVVGDGGWALIRRGLCCGRETTSGRGVEERGWWCRVGPERGSGRMQRRTRSVQGAGGSCFGAGEGGSWVSDVRKRSGRGDETKHAVFAVGTLTRIASGEAAQEILPGFTWSGMCCGSSR